MISAFDELRLDLLDAALDEALLLACGVVFGVLAQIAVRARLGDRLDDARALLGLEPLQLGAQPFRALRVIGVRFMPRSSLVQVLQAVHFASSR